VRRFMAMGFVLALALLTAETLLIYASTHLDYPLVSTDRTGSAASGAAATLRSDFVSRVIARTNFYRVANGCPALTTNAILMGTAQGHSQEMALRDYVGHNSADGTSPWDRIKAAGYPYRLVAENIAWGATAPEQVVDAWFFESPPNDAHRKNILNCALREIGVGYYSLANDLGNVTAHTYWTQDFGTRA
jgi:uncharacterized protein YkwD